MPDQHESCSQEISIEQRREIARCLEAAMRFAQDAADLVGNHFRSTCKHEADSLSREELLRVAAELRVERWDQAGIEVVSGAKLQPRDTSAVAASQFSCQVFRIWIERFGWELPAELLPAELLIERTDPEQFVQELAELLWRHRHLANELPSVERESGRESDSLSRDTTKQDN